MMKLIAVLFAFALALPVMADDAPFTFDFKNTGSDSYDSVFQICGHALVDFKQGIDTGKSKSWRVPEPPKPYAKTDRSLDLVRLASSPFSEGKLLYGTREQLLEALKNKNENNNPFDVGEIEFSEFNYPDVVIKSCDVSLTRMVSNESLPLAPLLKALVSYNGGLIKLPDDPMRFGDGGTTGMWSKNFSDRGVMTVSLGSGFSKSKLSLSFRLITTQTSVDDVKK